MGVRTYKLVNRSEQHVLLSRIEQGVQRWMELYAADDVRAQCALISPNDEAAVQGMRELEWIVATRAAERRKDSGSSERDGSAKPQRPAPLLALGLAEDWPFGLTSVAVSEGQAASLDAAGLKLMQDVGRGLFEDLGQTIVEAMLPKSAAEALAWRLAERVTGADGRAAAGGQVVVEPPVAADGHVLCTCRLGPSLTLMLIVWPATVTECLAPGAAKFAADSPLQPRSKALHAEAVELDAVAGEVELTIEELRSLSVGDVVKLNRKISQPLQICVRDGGVVCAARLGASKGYTAVQLTAGAT